MSLKYEAHRLNISFGIQRASSMRLILESNEPHYEALNGDPCVAKPTILPGDPGGEFVATPVESDDEAADDELAQAVSAQVVASALEAVAPAEEPAEEPAQAAEAAAPAEPGIAGLAWPIYPPLAALAAENIWKQGELTRQTPGILRKLQARAAARELQRVHALAQAGEGDVAGGRTHEPAAASAARGKADPKITLRPRPTAKPNPAYKGKPKNPGLRPPRRAMPPDPPNPPPDPRFGPPKQPGMPPPSHLAGMPNRPCPLPGHFPADLALHPTPPEMPPPTAELTEQEERDRQNVWILDLTPGGMHVTETGEMRSGH